MIRHGPTCLEGPVTKGRTWWVSPAPAAAEPVRSDFRPDLVRRVRADIAAGTYETPEKLELALARLLGRWGQE
jgi:hypothetical protein